MRRLSPVERKHILFHTVVRLQKDWVCRYGQWNTDKLLHELRRLLRRAEKDGTLETPDAPAPVTDAIDESLPLFDELCA
jgi:hypothetical protein